MRRILRTLPVLPRRVGLQWGERTFPVVPLALRGQEACLVLSDVPPHDEELRLILDWEDGAVTSLGGRLREVALDGRTARVDIHTVAGDWAPFLAYLGHHGY